MDEDVRRQLATMRNDVRSIKAYAAQLQAWSKVVEARLDAIRFAGDGHAIAIAELLAAVALTAPDPAACMEAVLQRLDSGAAIFSGQAERKDLGAAGPSETQTTVDGLRHRARQAFAAQRPRPATAAPEEPPA